MQRLAIDIGGTFTDAIVYDDQTNAIMLSKVSSTPKDYTLGLMHSIDKAKVNFDSLGFFAHGTTVCINAVIQGLLAPTALITTKGFRDLVEIGRGNRVEIYDPLYFPPPPLVPRELRFEADERLLYDGSVLKSIDENEIQKLTETVISSGVQSVAVCLLHSYANNSHEVAIRKALEEKKPGLHITISSEISNEYRDYERACTTILNSGLMPIMREYLAKIDEQLKTRNYDKGFYVMQSNGGMMSSSITKERPVFTVNSGLVGGIIAVRQLSKLLGIPNLIGADMGGTSFDVELITGGEYQMREVMKITTPTSGFDGYRILFPTVDIHAIGAGGGSIAWIDEGGALHVGPRSAAADPAPACYGRGGTEPTVTDANLILGRLSESNFLGGEMKVYPDLAKKAMKKIADRFNMTLEQAAAGVLKIVIHNMAGAIETMTVKRGIDPRECVMVSFGGAGPLHGPAIARELRIPEILIATMPGNFSAWGMLMADLKHDYVQTMIKSLDEVDSNELEQALENMHAKALRDLTQEGVRPEDREFIYQLDLRYPGQGHALTVPVSTTHVTDEEKNRVERTFDEMYLNAYLHNSPSEPKELASVRLTALGLVPKVKLPQIKKGTTKPTSDSVKGNRQVYLEDGYVSCPVYDRYRLLAGNQISGPAVVEETASTTLIWPNMNASVDEYGHLRIKTQ